MKKTRFLFALFMAIVMIAISPQRLWAAGTKPTSGDGSSGNPYQIANEANLIWFRDAVNGVNTGTGTGVGICGKLTQNITLTNAWTTTIGTSSKIYTGTFDGNNKTISGLNLTATAANAGLFGYVNGATIKNFTLAGSISSGYENTGSVVGSADGATKIYNVYSSVNITMTAAKSHIGGIAGQLLQENSKVSEIKGCAYSGTMNLGSCSDSNGGIVGYCEKNANIEIEYCFFSGSMSTSVNSPNALGGILGYADDDGDSQNFQSLKYCFVSGTLSPKSGTYVGAIAGQPKGKVANTGIIANNNYVSGVAANALGNSKTSATSTPITISVTAGSNGSVSKSYVNPTSTTATQLQVVATPNEHYHFGSWSDSGAQTHNVGLTANVSLSASFAIDQHTISVATNNANYGTVSGGGTFDYNSTKTITATPKTHYHFVQWSDGDKNASRTITVTENKTYTATFAIDQHTITVQTNNGNYGTVTGGGTFNYGASRTITATPKTGYHFVKWNDNNTNASRTITVSANATYTATFEAHTYGDWITDTPATCTTAGSQHHVCTKTGCGVSENGTIALLGHDFTVESTDVAYQKSAATCTADAVYYHKCSRCAEKGTTYWTNEGTALGHDMTVRPQEDPTCEETGSQAYWSCSRCAGKYFKDAQGTEEWGDERILSALGHDYAEPTAASWSDDCHSITFTRTCRHDDNHTISATGTLGNGITANVEKAATCTEMGITRYDAKVTLIDKIYVTYKEKKDIPALGHDMTHYPEVSPSCTQAGNYEYWTCSRPCCEGKFFTDQEGQNEWRKQPVYDPWPHRPDDNGVCVDCGQKITDPDPDDGGDVIEGEVVTMECTGTDGSAGYEGETYDKAFDGKTSTKWCHNTTNPWVEFTTASPVYVTGYKLSTANDSDIEHDRNPKNWVLKGWSAKEQDWASLDTKTNDNTLGPVKQKEYSFELKARTKDTYQRFRMEFTHSGLMQLSEISIMGIEPGAACDHVMTHHERKEATCTTAGNEEYWTCSQPCCDGIYFKNETGTARWNAEPVIAAGHDFSQEKAEDAYLHSPATCTAQARYYYSCTRCDESEEDANHTFAHGDKLEHVMAHHERKEATCATAGNEEYWTCSQLCCAGIYYKNETGTEKWDAEPVTSGHDFTQQKAEDAYLHSPATCTAQARYYYSCSRCGESEHNASHTFAHGTKLSHTLDADNVCTVCGTNFNATSKAVYADGTLTFYHDLSDHQSEGTVYALNTANNKPDWLENSENITAVVFDASFAAARPTSCYYWFYDCKYLATITGLNYLNTEEVTDMTCMFFYTAYYANGFSLDLSGFNTAKVTCMSSMFSYCRYLRNLDLRSFNTEKVTDMSYMFRGCSNLSSIDLSSFNTEKVTTMERMFEDCSLSSINLSNFNTENVKNMASMFYHIYPLKSLDLRSFNTKNVTDMTWMFYNDSQLTSLILGNFDMSSVTKSYDFFDSTINLKTLTLKSVPYLKDGTFNTQFSGDGVTVNYELDDNSVIYTGDTNYLPEVTSSASYTRHGIKNQWGTIVVPFWMSNGDDYDLYTLDRVSDEALFLNKVNDELAPGTPALIRLHDGKAGNYNLTVTASDPLIEVALQTGSSAEPIGYVSPLTLTGTYGEIDAEGNYGPLDITCMDGYIISNNKFWNIQEINEGGDKIYCAPFRAYLNGNGSNSPQMLSINWEEGTLTSVSDALEALTSDEAEIYDINGRRISSIRQGVNVVKCAGGKTKKIIVK